MQCCLEVTRAHHGEGEHECAAPVWPMVLAGTAALVLAAELTPDSAAAWTKLAATIYWHPKWRSISSHIAECTLVCSTSPRAFSKHVSPGRSSACGHQQAVWGDRTPGPVHHALIIVSSVRAQVRTLAACVPTRHVPRFRGSSLLLGRARGPAVDHGAGSSAWHWALLPCQ